MKNLYNFENGFCAFTASYKNETHSWWDEVDEDAIYDVIADPSFEEYVDRIVDDAMFGDLREAV